MIQVAANRQDHFGHGAAPAVPVHGFDRNRLAEFQIAGELFGASPECLFHFGTVDSPQPDPFWNAVMKDFDGVAVADADDGRGIGTLSEGESL